MMRNNFVRIKPLFGLLLLLILTQLSGCGEQRFQAREALNFELPALDGSASYTLRDYRGQVVYLTFWASWCNPCRQEMPYLAQLWERHQDEGFQVLAINVDEDLALARAFAAEYELPFPLLRDENREISTSYRVPGYPAHYIVDRSGRIRFSGLGFNINDVRAISQEVATLLAEALDDEPN
jgi:peroxiredoxin